MSNIFKIVNVQLSPTTKETLISWELDPKFSLVSASYIFYVEVAYSAGTWTRLNSTSPVTNQAYYTDTTSYRSGLINNIFYRVILVDGGTTYTSVPVSVIGDLTLIGFRLLKNILRQEYKRLTDAYAGASGWLLRRRHWGTACTVCTDFDLETQVVDDNCSTCYGTGIEGGYYNAYPLYIEFIPDKKSTIDFNTKTGTEEIIIRNVRCIAYPMITPYDIWIYSDSDVRYIIRSMSTIAELQGKDIVYSLELHEIPYGQVEYDIPLTTTSSSSSGGGGDEDETWRTA